jgi:D-aspartate ligase
MFSKYCGSSFVIPGIQADGGRLRSFLAKFRQEISSSAVIFSGSDIVCLNLSSLKDEMFDDFNIVLPSKEIVEALVNKKNFYHSLDKHRIPHPITHFPESFDDVKKISKDIDYPVYIRPAISPIFSARFNKKGFVARSEEELTRYCALVERYKIDFMIQEIIPGPAMNLFGICGYFNKSADPLGLFAYRRLREWPHKFGTNSLMESVSISDISRLKDLTVNYLHSVGYYGLMEAEFKKDLRDDDFKFLEVNARSWWQNSFPTKCGINLVLMAYLDATGDEPDYEEDYKAGVKWIYFLNDLRSVIEMLRKKEMTIPEWLYSLRMINDWAYFSTDDFLPWTLHPIFTLRKLIEKTCQKRMKQ